MIKSYKKDNQTYYVVQISFTDTKCKRHQKKISFDERNQRITSKTKARDIEFHYLSKMRAEAESNYTKLSFEKFLQKFLDETKLVYKKSTLMQYDGDLRKWLPKEFLEKPLNEFNKSYLHEFIFETMPTLGASLHTCKRIHRSLRRIFEAAIDDGFISINPARGIRVKLPQTKKMVLNTTEATRFLECARELSHPFYHLWAFALLTGMRSGELYALRWCDIDLTTNIITLSQAWTNKNGYCSTKNNKHRIIPISEDLRGLILELKNLGPFKDTLTGLNGASDHFEDFVLPRLNEWKFGQQAFVTSEFCKQISITPIKFHDLRATFITNLLAQGVSLPRVMSIVGHEKTSTTDEYLRLAGVDIKGVTESLGYGLPHLDQFKIIPFSNKIKGV